MLKPSLEVWAVSPSHLHLPLGLYFQWLQSDMADDFGMAAGIGESTKKIPILEMLKGGIIYLENPDSIATTIASPLCDNFFGA